MDRKEYCYKLADINEAIYDAENNLDDVNFKLMIEESAERREFFVNAQARLKSRISSLTVEKQELMEKYSYLVD